LRDATALRWVKKTGKICSFEGLRPVEGNKYTILLVFAPVFGVAPNVTYSNTLCLTPWDQLESGAILAYLFLRVFPIFE
jgi:hypothetical protein